MEWLISNNKNSFESPRKTIFGTKAQNFEITKVNKTKEIVEIEFKKQLTSLILEFWRFETALGMI